MPQINDYSDYEEFKTPGLYQIINKSSGAFLDLAVSNAAPGTAIVGFQNNGGADNQEWQIADVGDSKYLIICRKTGTYIRAMGARRWQGCRSSVGLPDHRKVHGKIVRPDAGTPQLTEFHSVTLQGDVLELEDGSETDGTEGRASGQNARHNGQQWLLKKITN